jgi:hypothetical protein
MKGTDMLDDVKLIHEALTDLEEHLADMPQTLKVKRARVFASRLHRRLHESVIKHADALPGDVVAFSGGTPKPPR